MLFIDETEKLTCVCPTHFVNFVRNSYAQLIFVKVRSSCRYSTTNASCYVYMGATRK